MQGIPAFRDFTIREKKAQKVDFRILFDPFRGFALKTVLGIYDPRIS